MGLLAGLGASKLATGREMIPPPPSETAMGALIAHLQNAERQPYQPMNVTFGLFPPLSGYVRKKDRGIHYARRAREALSVWRKAALIDYC